jgi:hypothetical protein
MSGAPPPGWTGLPQPPQQPSTDGFAIAAVVFGILGSALLSVPLGLVALRRIKRSGGAKTGRGLAIAGMAVGCVWLAIIPAALLLDLGDVFEHDNAERFSGTEREIAIVIDRYEEELGEPGGPPCEELLTRSYIEEIEAREDTSCEEFHDIGARVPADIIIERIHMPSGSTARVEVTELDKNLTFDLVREDGWKIDAVLEE